MTLQGHFVSLGGSGKFLVLELVQTIQGTGARLLEVEPPTYRIRGPVPLRDLHPVEIGGGDSTDSITRVVLGSLLGPWAEQKPVAFTCRTTFKAFQFRPLLKYFGEAARRLLIADEAGLGKTIEAGYIVVEEIARFGASRIVVICPPRLRRMWKAQLLNRFGLPFRVVSGDDLLRALEGQATSFMYIVSMDASRRMDLERLERLPPGERIDLVVVDEIHRMIGRGGEILRRRLGLSLSTMSEGFVGLSATPVQLQLSDLERVLDIVTPGLFDEDAFSRELAATTCLNQIRNLLARLKWDEAADTEFQRLLGELEHASRRLIPDEMAAILEFLATCRESKVKDPQHRQLLRERSLALTIIQRHVSRVRATEVGESRERLVIDDVFPLDTEERKARQADRVVSVSEQSLYDSVDRFLSRSFSFVHRRQLASCLPVMIELLRLGTVGASKWEARESEERDPRDETTSLSENEKRECQEFVDLFGLLPRDTKLRALRERLEQLQSDGSVRKAIVFTHWIPTFRHLRRRLPVAGGFGVIPVDPTSSDDQVEAAIASFERREDFCVLVATDLLREGLDLQTADCVVNYDLSYNPQDLEQRVGRIDRVGQVSSRVYVVNILVKDSLDDKVYETALKRIGIFRTTVGDLRPIVETMARELETMGNISREEAVRAAAELRQQQELMNHTPFSGVEGALDNRIREAHDARAAGVESLGWMILARFFKTIAPTCGLTWDPDRSSLLVEGLPAEVLQALRLLVGHENRSLVDTSLAVAQRPGQGVFAFNLGGGNDALPPTHPIMRTALGVSSRYYGVEPGIPIATEHIMIPSPEVDFGSGIDAVALLEYHFAGTYVRERRWCWWGIKNGDDVTPLDGVDTAGLLTLCSRAGLRTRDDGRPSLGDRAFRASNQHFITWAQDEARREVALQRVALQSSARLVRARLHHLDSSATSSSSGSRLEEGLREGLTRQLTDLTSRLESVDLPETLKRAATNATSRVVLTVERGGT